MRGLIACERSAIIRDAFRALGHDFYSCDIEPCEAGPAFHFQKDVFQCIEEDGPFDFFGVHPECRFLTVSGFHWNYRQPERAAKTDDALIFAKRCFALCECHKFAYLENSVSILSTRIKEPTQTIQPYDFGEDASKRTCLWLWNLPRLESTMRIPGRKVEWPKGSGNIVERWSNQTDSGQNKLGPSETRSMDRARTYYGIAKAMAEQWTNVRQLALI